MPILPQGVAQSNTGRCSGLRCGAPSRVMAPQTWMLAASMSFLREAEEGQQVEVHVAELLGGDAERFEEIGAQRPLVEDELDVEGGLGRGVERGDLVVGEALGAQRRRVDAGRLVEVAVADGVGLDLGDLGLSE